MGKRYLLIEVVDFPARVLTHVVNGTQDPNTDNTDVYGAIPNVLNAALYATHIRSNYDNIMVHLLISKQPLL